jgi:hypothetical protein
MTRCSALLRTQRYLTRARQSLPVLKRIGRAFTFGALALAMLSNVFFLVDIDASRQSPIETDDAYAYMIKATHLFDVSTSQAPAYRDLKAQLKTPAIDENDAWIKYNERHRLTAVFAPLHSFALVALKRLFEVSWEQAYSILGWIGAALQTFAALLFLHTIFGTRATALAAISLATIVLPHHGLHFVVPSTLAIAFGLISLALLFLNAPPLLLFASCILSVGMHPIGRIYTTLVLLMALIGPYCAIRAPKARALAPLAALTLALILPQLFPEEMEFTRDPLPAGTSYWASLYMSASHAKDLVFETFPRSSLAVLLLALLGFLGLPRIRRDGALVLFAITLLALGASLFYVLPHFPAELFSRIWVLAAILILGFLSQGCLTLLTAVGATLAIGFRANKQAPLRAHHLQIFILTGASILFAPFLQSMLGEALLQRAEVAQFAKDRRDVTFKTSAVDAILSATSPKDTVFYPSEEPMHFALMHGLADRRALYYPLLASVEPLLDQSVRYPAAALSFSPLFRGPLFHVHTAYTGLHDLDTGAARASQNGILLHQSEWLEFVSEDEMEVLSFRLIPSTEKQSLLTRVLSPLPKASTIRLVGELGNERRCEVSYTCTASSCELPPQCRGLLTRLRIQPDRPVRITGITKAGPSQHTNWPWNAGLSVCITDRASVPTTNRVNLDTSFVPGDAPWKVLDDAGGLLALKKS